MLLLSSSLLVPCQFVVLRVHWGSINYQKRAIPANEQKRVRKTMKTNAGPAVRDEEDLHVLDECLAMVSARVKYLRV